MKKLILFYMAISKIDKEMAALQTMVKVLGPLTKETQVKIINAVYVKCFPKELHQIELEFEMKKLQAFQGALKQAFPV